MGESTRLHPNATPWAKGRGNFGTYDVYRVPSDDGIAFNYIFDGQLVVERSKIGIYDLCRAMLKLGYKGTVREIDQKTGVHCMSCDIVRGSKLTVRENSKGIYVDKYEAFPDHLKRMTDEVA